MSIVWMVISASLAVGAAVPYVIDILRSDEPKQKVVTWVIWTILTGVGCVASFADGQIPSALLTLVMTLQTGTIAVLLLVKGASRRLESLDRWCLVGAMVGLVLWPIFNSPAVTIVAMITIDIIGAVPTLKHSWQKPHEEKGVTFLLTGVAGFIALCVAGSWQISAVAYPLYLLLLYATLTSFIAIRSSRVLPAEELGSLS